MKTLHIFVLIAFLLLSISENRLKAQNQGTGYRVQATGSREPNAQLDSSSTPISDLPSSISNLGVTPKLAMDPSSTSKLGEGMKALSSRFAKASVYPEEEGAISAAVRIKPSAVPSNSSSYAKYVVPENASVAAYGSAQQEIASQDQENSMTSEAKEFEDGFSKMIADAKDQAEETDQEAEKVLAEAKEKASKSENLKRVWENVIGKATEAETAYKTLIQLYMQYRGYLAQYYTGEVLNSKRVQYNQDQKQAAVKRDYWVNEIKNANECLQGRQIPDSNFETEEVVNASDQTHLSVDKQIPMTSIHHEKDKSLCSQLKNNHQINTVSEENRVDSDDAVSSSFTGSQAVIKKNSKEITPVERSSSHMIKVADFEDSFDQKIKTAKTIVEATTMIAFAARTKAEKAVTSEELWAKAIEEAEKAEQAYNELLSIYKNYQEQVVSYYPADLIDVTRSRYGSDYKIAEIERNRLSTEIKEYNIIQELQQNANTAWDDAIEAARQADEANMLAERTKTESAYTKLNLLAQNAQDLWIKAVKAKQTLLSKASEANKSSITEKINTAISRNEHYSEKAKVALKNAQEVAEKEAAKELRETQEIATRAWDNAVEAIRRFDEASVAAERTKTESAYNEVNRLAQNTQNMWMKAAEAQKVVLSKTAESEKTAVTEKINAATRRNKQYNEKAQEALKNAQEAARKEAARKEAAKKEAEVLKERQERERQTKAELERSAVQAAKELREVQQNASTAWDNAIEAACKADESAISGIYSTEITEHETYRRLARYARDAWSKALETQKGLLFKATETDKPAINSKITIATSRHKEYSEKTREALQNACKKEAWDFQYKHLDPCVDCCCLISFLPFYCPSVCILLSYNTAAICLGCRDSINKIPNNGDDVYCCLLNTVFCGGLDHDCEPRNSCSASVAYCCCMSCCCYACKE